MPVLTSSNACVAGLPGSHTQPQHPLLPLQALRAAGGRGFSDTSGGGGGGAADARAGFGLLYALSGSLKPLCCWCVEGGGSVSSSDGGAAGAGAGAAAAAAAAAAGAAGAAGAAAADASDDEGGQEDNSMAGLIARITRAVRTAPSSR